MAQYIDKDALVADITHKIKVLEAFIKNFDRISDKVEKAKNKIEALSDELLLLDTIEVKEADLDSAIRTYLTNHFNIYEDGVLQSKKSGLPLSTYDIIKVAKHFFELGLKAQKGE